MLRCCRDPSCCTTGRINSRVPLLSTAECPSYQQLGLCSRNPSKDALYAATAAAFAMSVGKPRTNQENKQTTGPTFRWMFLCLFPRGNSGLHVHGVPAVQPSSFAHVLGGVVPALMLRESIALGGRVRTEAGPIA